LLQPTRRSCSIRPLAAIFVTAQMTAVPSSTPSIDVVDDVAASLCASMRGMKVRET
jgi:hypothetical protein